jgi:hypothetical protein
MEDTVFAAPSLGVRIIEEVTKNAPRNPPAHNHHGAPVKAVRASISCRLSKKPAE